MEQIETASHRPVGLDHTPRFGIEYALWRVRWRGSGRLWRIVQGFVDDLLRGGDQEQQSAEWQQAWHDLERELEHDSEEIWRESNDSRSPFRSAQQAPAAIPDELVDDYYNLNAPPTASLTELHSAYHDALRAYHPDRFGSDPRKFAIATEIAKRLNRSWLRIRAFHIGSATPSVVDR